MKYYAVAVGVAPGLYMNWDDCLEVVKGYPGAKYKSFNNVEDAKKYLKDNNCPISYEEPNISTGGQDINFNFDLSNKSKKIVNDPKYYVNKETKYTYYQGMTYFNKLVYGFLIRNNDEVFIAPINPLIKKHQINSEEIEAWAIKLYRVKPESVVVYTEEIE